MRVLFLTQTFPRFAEDTAGPFIRELARGLVRGGDEVTVLTPSAPDVPAAWEVDGVTVRSFRYAPDGWEVLGYGRSLARDEAIRWRAGLVTPLYLRGARRAVLRALRRGSFDLVQAHWVVPNAIAAHPASSKVALAVGLHGSDVFLAERRGVRAWVRRALGRTSVLTGCSPELVDRVCAVGFPAERSRVIPYGVDVAQFRPGQDASHWRRELGIPPDAVMALSVGRMVSKKGYDVLFEALPTLMEAEPDLHLVLGGEGDLLEDFQRRAAAWPGRVHLPGIVLRDRLPDLYRAADLFVLPAVHDEKGNVDGLPNVILEAMASGLPVVASGITGIPLAVTHGENGLLVPERRPDELAGAVARLARGAEERRRFGEASRRRAERDLTWDAVAARYREAYEVGIRHHRQARR